MGVIGIGGTVATTFFSRTYDEAFALAQETRDYLAVYGEEDVRHLESPANLAFSLESLRMTARLTHVMAWLMAQRAAHNGEIERSVLSEEKWRLGGRDICLGETAEGAEDLPVYIKDLMRRSENLYRRVARLDELVARESRELA